MNILIVTPIFPPDIGGPAIFARNISFELIDERNKVSIITLADNEKKEVLRTNKNREVILYGVKRKNHFPFLRHFRLFMKIIAKSKDFHLIFSQGSVVMGPISLICTKLLQKPLVIKFVGDVAWETATREKKTSKTLEKFLSSPISDFKIRLIKLIQKVVLKKSTKIIVPSNYLKWILIKGYNIPKNDIVVIHNSFILPKIPKESQKKEEGPFITTICRLVSWKRVDQIIQMLPPLIKSYPNIQLKIIGDGPLLSSLISLVKNLKLEKHVRFYGNLSHYEAMKILNSSHLFILNSIYEGLPHVVLEAMALDIPVIATRINGTREVITHDKTGILIDPKNSNSLLKQTKMLLANEKLRQFITLNAKKNLEARFSRTEMIQKYKRLFNSLFVKEKN
ncbi:MAG: glycosyltransferase family 4 protein [Candidatus Helarchaeota archaeon]